MSWKLIQTNIRIYSNQNIDTNEYPNIFVSEKLTRTNIRIYSYSKNDTNKYPNKYSDQKFEYLNIFEIYLDICSYNLLDTNIFGYSFVARFWYEYIRIFVLINFQDTNRFRRCFCLISLDITLCLWIFCWWQWTKIFFRL